MKHISPKKILEQEGKRNKKKRDLQRERRDSEGDLHASIRFCEILFTFMRSSWYLLIQ